MVIEVSCKDVVCASLFSVFSVDGVDVVFDVSCCVKPDADKDRDGNSRSLSSIQSKIPSIIFAAFVDGESALRLMLVFNLS